MFRFQGKGVVIGGIAASLLGKPRLTADLDAMLLLSVAEVSRLIRVAKEEGLEPRIPEAEEFARRHRVLLLRHIESGTNIDITLGILPFEVEVVERSVLVPIASISIRLPTPEDLIIMKAIAHRPRDLLDIQAVIDSHPDLDRQRIKDWVMQFAEALEMPGLWDDIAGWL
jgi:Nucleotidyltransferase of unknown function (DUF6036)